MNKKYDVFMKSYHGKQLREKNSLEDYGIWCIRGADTNCDMGGSHFMPILGYYEGKLKTIIAYAVELSGFWSWGEGSIEEIRYEHIDEGWNANAIKLLEKKKVFEAGLARVNEELGKMGIK